jgi:hypothetical protein
LKIAGSKAEFLVLGFEIKNFFLKQYMNLIQGKNAKFCRNNAFLEFICGCKNKIGKNL